MCWWGWNQGWDTVAGQGGEGSLTVSPFVEEGDVGHGRLAGALADFWDTVGTRSGTRSGLSGVGSVCMVVFCLSV